MIELEDVKRLRLEPGDVLVLTLPREGTEHDVAQLREEMKIAFPEHRTAVVAHGMELSVVSKSVVEELVDG